MALNKDILGMDLFNVRQSFSNKTRDELLALYGNDDGIRLAACKKEAEAIINHFKDNGLVHIGVANAGPYTVMEVTPGNIE